MKQEFQDIFPELVEEFVQHVTKSYTMPAFALERLEQLINYTCLGGKCYRGGLTVDTAFLLCQLQGVEFSPKKRKSIVLGWCIEILQAMFLVADDIMDRSVTRRGQPCWYLQPDVKMDAVNDSLILESFLYFLLKKYFGKEAIYSELVDLYHEVSFQTQMGQMLDLKSQPQGRKDPKLLDNFTMDTYLNIITYKTAFYTFYLPMASALLICGMNGDKEMTATRNISIALGRKFQIQDDYLDCFGDPAVIGKIGTDIKDHKCTWLVALALTMMTSEQRTLLETYYGKEDEESETQIKDLYRSLELPEKFAAQEQSSYEDICQQIDACADMLPKVMFTRILKKVHGRKK